MTNKFSASLKSKFTEQLLSNNCSFLAVYQLNKTHEQTASYIRRVLQFVIRNTFLEIP